MTTNSTMPTPSSTEGEQFLCDDWFDPLENGVRTRIRGFIEELLEAELDAALGRARYERPGAGGGGSPESSAGEDTMFKSRLLIEDGRKTGHTFSQPDLIIAATALHHGLTVVTRDVSDYQNARTPVLNPWLDTPPMRSSAESNAT